MEPNDKKKNALARTALYVRSATDDEKIFEDQIALLQSCADRNGLQIVRHYVDGGVSGLTQGPKQKEMLEAARTGTADFSVILMRDISRWGRFQDCDVSTCYEFLCRSAGIEVCYVLNGDKDTAKAVPGMVDLGE
jgi:DNA invertase Pin-like site-specific DNA recombinase